MGTTIIAIIQLYIRSSIAIAVKCVHIFILTDHCSLILDNGWLHGVVLSAYQSMFLGKIVDTASCFNRFWAGIPKVSQYSLLFISYKSSVKWFKLKTEVGEGPFQSFLCCFTALIHLLFRLSSFGNLCKLYPIPVVVLQSAATQLRWAIAKSRLDSLKCGHLNVNSCTYNAIHLTFCDAVETTSSWAKF